MSSNAALLKQAKSTKVETDHSKTTAGGSRMPEVGKCPARLVGYVELGVHPQPEFKGKAKKPELEVQLTFECFGKQNIDEIETKDGKKKKVGRILRMLPMTLKLNERAKFSKLFKDMDYGRGLDHMSKMLNDVFQLTIKHKKSKNGNEYAYIERLESPLVEQRDPETQDIIGHIDITEKVPPASWDLQLFIVEKPTFEQWNSIEIEGTYTKTTKTEDGEEIEEEVSKNFIQEKIMESLDWEGSNMQALLLDLEDEEESEDESEEEVEDTVEEEEVEEEVEAPKTKKKTTKSKTTKKTTTNKKAPAKKAEESGEDTDAMLAELGLA